MNFKGQWSKGKLENSWAPKRFKLNPIKCTNLEGERKKYSKQNGKIINVALI